MNIARQIFNNQHCITELIDLFAKKQLLLTLGGYYLLLRVCQLAKHCIVVKNDKGFDITVDANENTVLINDMKKQVLNKRMIRKCNAS